jgi:hypothetical protein
MDFSNVTNPGIRALVAETDQDWGDPEAYQKQLIQYRIGPEFDGAMWGINVEKDTELITIQAPAKQRKSTLLANLLLNFGPQMHEKKIWMCLHTLESGMNRKDYRDVMLGMITTRLMVSKVYGGDRSKWPQAQDILAQKDLKTEEGHSLLRITRKFLRAGKRNSFQQECINEAKKLAPQLLPLSIFGPGRAEGSSRDLNAVLAAWELLYEGKFPGMEGCLHRIFALDHIQQLKGFTSSFQLLQEAVPRLSDFVVSHPGAAGIILSQVSLTSRRSAESGNGEMDAAGGTKLAEESNTVMQTAYDEEKDPLHLYISTPYSRYEPPPTMRQDVEPFSGVALGFATRKR